MILAIVFTKNLEIGIKEIDDQHKELFKRVNDLFEACNKKMGKEEIGSTLNFLCSYVHKHFSDEQKYQLKYNYPEYAQHLKIHNAFLKEVDEMKKEFDENGATIGFIIKFNQKVVDWLINHIGKTDKQFGNFVNAQVK